jgi:hypothetical protein
MYIQNDLLVFETGRTVHCIDGMMNISANGMLRTVGHDSVILEHKLSRKEKIELAQDLQEKINSILQNMNHD